MEEGAKKQATVQSLSSEELGLAKDELFAQITRAQQTLLVINDELKSRIKPEDKKE